MKILIRSLACLFVILSSAAFAAETVPVTVKEEGKTFQGDLYFPKGAKGSLPLVLVVHEWWGKTEYPMMRAKKIADELGYAALAVDLFGGKTVATPAEAQALATPFYEKPATAVKRLQAFIPAAQDAAKKAKISLDLSKIAAVGYCFGGSMALNLARSGGLPDGEKLVAVVALHAGLASSLKSAGKIEPRILVLHGEADPMVKKEEVAAFKEEMRQAKADLKFIGYPGAMHAFTNPKATELGKKHGIPIAYNKDADQSSWKEMTGFLKTNLSK